jgi:hypothetical protein
MPPGALNIAADLAIEESVPMSETSVASTLSLSAEIKVEPIGAGMIIRPTKDVDLTTMIRDNLGESVVGREQKLGAGLVYAEAVGASAIAVDLRALGARPLPESSLLGLARAIAPSPAGVNADVVETVTFISLLQLLHRLQGFYEGASRRTGTTAPETQRLAASDA